MLSPHVCVSFSDLLPFSLFPAALSSHNRFNGVISCYRQKLIWLPKIQPKVLYRFLNRDCSYTTASMLFQKKRVLHFLSMPTSPISRKLNRLHRLSLT